MKVLGVIPARYQSTRFPGKPLVLIDGVPMIVRVYHQAMKCSLFDHVIVATDSLQIQELLNHHNIPNVMTSEHHISGTDRCIEVVEGFLDYDIVLNIQGDEPFIRPEQLELVIQTFDNKKVEIATLVKKIENSEDIENPNIIKVVKSENNKALYFSRSPIPYVRNLSIESWPFHFDFFKHIGIYGFKMEVLWRIKQLQASNLEKAESLEQLRWLENGIQIYVNESNFETIGIDTPEDLLRINNQ